MPVQYRVSCQNNTQLTASFCIFQILRYPDSGLAAQPKSLTWFTKKVHPRTGTQFAWTDEVFFIWGEYVSPELIFTASRLKTDMIRPRKRSAQFSYQDGAYTLKYSSYENPDHSKLQIHTDDTVISNQAVVGIGNCSCMTGCSVGAIVYDAFKNLNYPIRPEVDYYITFGNYKGGQVIDLNSISTPVQKIPFSQDKLSFKVIMRRNNLLAVKQDLN